MSDKQIAYTILTQIGGSLFCAMVGVKESSVIPGGVRIKFKARARNRANAVDIRLNGNDLYDMRFFRIWRTTQTECGTVTDLYADSLEETFRNATGLATRF
jgi:hypothetical protein